jgi:hypothetical protein
MNIREFVRDVLTQVMDGVRDAQEGNPSDKVAGDMDYPKLGVVNPCTGHWPEMQSVAFDLSVEARSASGGSTGWHVEVAGLAGIGRAGKDADHSSTVANRIQFSVPVLFPFQVKDAEEGLGS